ncbi:MAG: LysR family transcriptional regulator [Rhodospirillales bacterium]|nr:LysR family transcriptional regulator [Rhodospirillales bacterium]
MPGRASSKEVRPLLRGLEDAENAVRAADSLGGSLRIAMSVAFGVREIIPILPPFLAAHPRLEVEFVISDDQQDLIVEGADIAIRVGRLPDSGFGARRLATSPRYVVASPAYLAARGVPNTLSDLSSHDCIFGPGGSGRTGWTFIRDGAPVSITVGGRIQTASAEGVIACVKAGLGLAVASVWMCREEFASGALVPVLADYALEPVEAHAVFPGGPHPSSKVRALVDHLITTLGKQAPQAVRPRSES